MRIQLIILVEHIQKSSYLMEYSNKTPKQCKRQTHIDNQPFHLCDLFTMLHWSEL